MSYLTIKIISLVVLVVILLVVFVNQNNKKDQVESDMNMLDGKESLPAEQPADEEEKKIDYKAIHDEMYYVEYKLIPHLVELYSEQPYKAEQIATTIYENLVTLQNNLRKIHPVAFGKVSGEVLGNPYKECLVTYTFPKPLDMPLAKYGAIYFNLAQRKYQYWTLEKSLNDYVLGSKTSTGHANYGHREDMTKEEFIHEVCQVMGLEESILQPRNKICRQDMIEMNDRSFQDAITHDSPVVVCFYDFNKPSEIFIAILERVAQEYNSEITIGVYDVYGGEEYTEAVTDYGIMHLPTLLFFKEEKLVNRHIGICSSADLKAMFEEIV